MSISIKESCTCFDFATLYSVVGLLLTIKYNVRLITALRSTVTLNIVIGVPTDYSYGNVALRRFSQLSIINLDREREHMQHLTL